MAIDISSIEPLLPRENPKLQELAFRVTSESSSLVNTLHPKTLESVRGLLRIVNSFYSNLIEGNSTHPSDIERATQEDYATDTAKRNLQIESNAHILCQIKVEKRLEQEPDIHPATEDFIRWVHQIFYARLPDELKNVEHHQTNERIPVVGGALRHRGVLVGNHQAPHEDLVSDLLSRFSQTYTHRVHGSNKIIAAAASHHRLMWIHPFLDGNGRVARLFTDAYLRSIPLQGYGLWNVSRGFARDRETYMNMLSRADQTRKGDLDGRGYLSEKALIEFCEYFLNVCLDQISYMSSLLDLDGFLTRIDGYVKMRNAGLIPAPLKKYPSLKLEASPMLRQVALQGELPRGEVAVASGLASAGKVILRQLLDEGILKADMPRGPVRLGLPVHLATYLFPDLYPTRNGLRVL